MSPISALPQQWRYTGTTWTENIMQQNGWERRFPAAAICCTQNAKLDFWILFLKLNTNVIDIITNLKNAFLKVRDVLSIKHYVMFMRGKIFEGN
jgi:hypothetical protein